MTETLESARGALVISDEHIPFSAYQAIYHKVTKKVERRSRYFPDAYTINFEDIKNLHFRLAQLLTQYSIKGSRCEVSHALKDGYTNTYSSMEKFNSADLSFREPTRSLSYSLDFLIVLPAEIPEASEIAQRYKIEVVFEKTYINDDDPRIPYFIRALPSYSTLHLLLEYSDYAVAQAIEATVAGWVNSLPKRSVPKVVKYLTLIERPVDQLLPFLVRVISLIVGAAFLASSVPLGWKAALSIVLYYVALGHLSYAFVNFLIGAFYRQLRKFAPNTEMVLTNGDVEGQEKAQRLVSDAKGVIVVLGLGVGLATVTNIFSAWLYEKVFGL